MKKTVPVSEQDIETRQRIMKLCDINEEDLPPVYMSKILIKLDDLFAEIRLLKQSQIHSHLPFVEREIAYLEGSHGLDYDQTKQLEVLIKLKQFIYEKPTGLSKSSIDKLSEAELIARLSPQTVERVDEI